MRRIYSYCVTLSMVLLLCCCGGTQDGGDNGTVRVSVVVIGGDSVSVCATRAAVIEAQEGVSLSFATTGVLSQLPVVAGTVVARGQTIAVLDGATPSHLLTSALAAKDIATETLSQAEDGYARMEQLHTAGSISELQWIEIETQLSQARAAVRAAEAQVAIAERGVSDCHLVAPCGGYVAQTYATVGEQIAPGQPIAQLVDINTVKVKFSVSEQDISQYAVGQTLSVTVPRLGVTLSGTVCEKGVVADVLSRSYDVWVRVANNDHRLLPGMLCEVLTPTVTASDALPSLLAHEVLIDTDNSRYVWVVRHGHAQKQTITTGENVGERVVITSGIAPGDTIITAGKQKVWQGAPLAIAP